MKPLKPLKHESVCLYRMWYFNICHDFEIQNIEGVYVRIRVLMCTCRWFL